MRKDTKKKWIDAGYELLANEGAEGIRVERLARILHLNKSGFYHYFNDPKTFFHHLLMNHAHRFDLLVYDLYKCKNIEPDCLNVLLEHKVTIVAQIQLVRNRSNPFLLYAHKEYDEKLVQAILPLWVDYVDFYGNPDLACQYLGLVRDMFYTRVNRENFNLDYLYTLTREAKEIVEKIVVSAMDGSAKKISSNALSQML